ncbi:hypothetical protein [Bacillus cereus]|nr:hypothetical protein [Bacillus cereus]
MYCKSEAIIKIKELGRLYKQGDISEQFYNDKVAEVILNTGQNVYL